MNCVHTVSSLLLESCWNVNKLHEFLLASRNSCDLGVSGLPGVFLRWNRPSKFLEEAEEERINIIKYNKELQAKVNALRRQLAELETDEETQEEP